jgi:hypothetical protein
MQDGLPAEHNVDPGEDHVSSGPREFARTLIEMAFVHADRRRRKVLKLLTTQPG